MIIILPFIYISPLSPLFKSILCRQRVNKISESGTEWNKTELNGTGNSLNIFRNCAFYCIVRTYIHDKKQRLNFYIQSLSRWAYFLLCRTLCSNFVVNYCFKNMRKLANPCIYWLFTTPVAFLAEKERFELSKPFWGLHDFQSCALDQARRLLRVLY